MWWWCRRRRLTLRVVGLVALLASSALGQLSRQKPQRIRCTKKRARAGACVYVRPLITSAKVFGGLNAVGFGVSLLTDSHVHLDLIGTGAFTVAAYTTRGENKRSALSSWMVGAWATRLATFLFYRALETGRDSRLEDTLSSVGGAFGFWLVSFAWGWLTMLPHTLGAEFRKTPKLGYGAVGACVLYAIGLATEISADLTKWKFKQSASNRGKFCTAGVWAVSQHPNYFGNLCLWVAIWLINAPTLANKAPQSLLTSAISPLFLATLFIGQAVGTIGPALDFADRKYGHLHAYHAYKEDVPLIVPRPLQLLRVLAGLPIHRSNNYRRD